MKICSCISKTCEKTPCGFAETFTFDLLISKPNQFIFVPNRTKVANSHTRFIRYSANKHLLYTVFQKSDAKIQTTITTAYLIRIRYPFSGFNYHLSDVDVANFNKIHRTVSEQQLF